MRRGLRFHVDGARICNAAAALGVPLDRLCAGADSISVCLSKASSVVAREHHVTASSQSVPLN